VVADARRERSPYMMQAYRDVGQAEAELPGIEAEAG